MLASLLPSFGSPVVDDVEEEASDQPISLHTLLATMYDEHVDDEPVQPESPRSPTYTFVPNVGLVLSPPPAASSSTELTHPIVALRAASSAVKDGGLDEPENPPPASEQKPAATELAASASTASVQREWVPRAEADAESHFSCRRSASAGASDGTSTPPNGHEVIQGMRLAQLPGLLAPSCRPQSGGGFEGGATVEAQITAVAAAASAHLASNAAAASHQTNQTKHGPRATGLSIEVEEAVEEAVEEVRGSPSVTQRLSSVLLHTELERDCTVEAGAAADTQPLGLRRLRSPSSSLPSRITTRARHTEQDRPKPLASQRAAPEVAIVKLQRAFRTRALMLKHHGHELFCLADGEAAAHGILRFAHAAQSHFLYLSETASPQLLAAFLSCTWRLPAPEVSLSSLQNASCKCLPIAF